MKKERNDLLISIAVMTLWVNINSMLDGPTLPWLPQQQDENISEGVFAYYYPCCTTLLWDLPIATAKHFHASTVYTELTVCRILRSSELTAALHCNACSYIIAGFATNFCSPWYIDKYKWELLLKKYFCPVVRKIQQRQKEGGHPIGKRMARKRKPWHGSELFANKYNVIK